MTAVSYGPTELVQRTVIPRALRGWLPRSGRRARIHRVRTVGKRRMNRQENRPRKRATMLWADADEGGRGLGQSGAKV